MFLDKLLALVSPPLCVSGVFFCPAGAVSFVHIVKAAEPLFTALFRYVCACTVLFASFVRSVHVSKNLSPEHPHGRPGWDGLRWVWAPRKGLASRHVRALEKLSVPSMLRQRCRSIFALTAITSTPTLLCLSLSCRCFGVAVRKAFTPLPTGSAGGGISVR